MTLRGVDISHHQNDAGLNLGALLGAVDFVIVKATQGTGYTDARYAVDIAAARAVGKLCGSYHYAGGTGVVPGDPVAEADHYLSVANHQPGEILVLDYEPAKPPADPDGWCAAFCTRVRDRTGVVPLVYMSGSVARSGTWAKTRALGARLWIAQYGTNTGTKPTTPPAVGAWGSYVMWQYTSNGRMPGASGVLDVNEFYGDAPLWRALGNPTQEDDMPSFDDPLFTDNPGTPEARTIRFRDWALELRDDQAVILDFLQNATGGDLRLLVAMQRQQQEELTGLRAALTSLAEAYAAGRDDLTAEELTAAVDEGIRRGGAAVLAAQEAARAAHPNT